MLKNVADTPDIVSTTPGWRFFSCKGGVVPWGDLDRYKSAQIVGFEGLSSVITADSADWLTVPSKAQAALTFYQKLQGLDLVNTQVITTA